MGIRFICDGCGQPIEQAQAQRFGWVAHVWYCADCAARWKTVETQIDAARQGAVETFQTTRAAVRAAARPHFQALPDE